MPRWKQDPAVFPASRCHGLVPAEERAYVICTAPARNVQPRMLCVVDVNPTSPAYGEVIHEIAIAQPEDRPAVVHHAPRVIMNAPWHTQQIAPVSLLAQDPTGLFGFVGSGIDPLTLSSSISAWRLNPEPRSSASGALSTVIAIAGAPVADGAAPGLPLPDGVVPALITDMALSPDSRFLYVACWGTGELRQFDVSNPLDPREIASVRVGGIVARAPHPSQARQLDGGPATITVSHDGRRLYVTNASPVWESHFYPDGLNGWMVKIDADLAGGISIDPNFFLDFGDRRPLRVHVSGQRLDRP